MSLANQDLTRWTVSVPRETDTALRCFLAERGMKKGDISKFIVDAVKWRVFEQTVSEIREKFSDLSPAELQSIVDEATESARVEMRASFIANEA
ncbi:MAG: ribbon-helix-helix domain-containing protein [Pseudomonadota bacterium]